ncbi:MAG: hypothetical protein ABIJ47_04730 [Candidatus Bathyarchaeota archaeon]
MLSIIICTQFYIVNVHGSEIEAVLIPHNGEEDANIFLKIRGIMTDASLYVYWDDYVLEQGFKQNIPKGDEPGAGFDYNFKIPTQSKYRTPGEHTVYIEISYNIFVEQPRLHKEARSFSTSLVFQVDEPVVMIDYEQKYNDLLVKYDSLQGDYDSLLKDYNELSQSYNELNAQLENTASSNNISGYPIVSILIAVALLVVAMKKDR